MVRKFVFIFISVLFTLSLQAEILNVNDIHPFPRDSEYNTEKVNSYGKIVSAEKANKFIHYKEIQEKINEAYQFACAQDEACTIQLRKKNISLAQGTYSFYTYIYACEKTLSSAMFVFRIVDGLPIISEVQKSRG